MQPYAQPGLRFRRGAIIGGACKPHHWQPPTQYADQSKGTAARARPRGRPHYQDRTLHQSIVVRVIHVDALPQCEDFAEGLAIDLPAPLRGVLFGVHSFHRGPVSAGLSSGFRSQPCSATCPIYGSGIPPRRARRYNRHLPCDASIRMPSCEYAHAARWGLCHWPPGPWHRPPAPRIRPAQSPRIAPPA
jgi:hypothetical protein